MTVASSGAGVGGLAAGEKRALLARLLAERRAREDGPPPLSFGQLRLWFLDRLEPGNPAYNMPAGARLLGTLDRGALAAAVGEIVRRHEPLRTALREEGGRPLQVVLPPPPAALPCVDLSALAAGRREREARRLAAAESLRPFDLAAGAPLRTLLVRQAAEEHLFLVTFHHAACDEWSRGLFIGELAALYAAAVTGVPARLPELTLRYAEYAVRQRESLRGGRLAEQLSFWRQRLAGEVAVLELPADRPPPARPSGRGAKRRIELPGELSRAVRELARRRRATPFMVLLAAFQALLARYSGQADVPVGTPVAGRDGEESERLIGFFVNTLVLRTDLGGDPSFLAALDRVRAVALDAFAHREMPFERLVEELAPERDLAHDPFFQVMFVLQNAPAAGAVELPGLRVAPLAVEGGTAKFDLRFSLVDGGGGFSGFLEYKVDRFDATTVERTLRHFTHLLASALADPERRLSALDLFAAAERHQLLGEANDARRPGRDAAGFLGRFAAEARRRPDAVAVTCRGAAVSYGELAAAAFAAARGLVADGVRPGSVVALAGERGADLLTAILAVLAAEAAWLPLDPRQPAERLRAVLAQSGAARVVACGPLSPALAAAVAALPEAARPRVVALADLRAAGEAAGPAAAPRPADPRALAYVIFTSGSTGAPKGAMVEHRGMFNHLLAKVEDLRLDRSDVVAQNASQCFDISVWQMLAPLAVGGRVAFLVDEDAEDPLRLARAVEAEEVTVLEVVPSMLGALLEELGREGAGAPDLAALRWLVLTGEELPASLAAAWLSRWPAVPVVNAYGPTECSDDVTHHVVRRAGTGPVPIGRTLANLRLYVLDRHMRPAPFGVAGALHVAGVGVGRGYIDDPGRTAAAFLPDPFSPRPGGRLYATGDLVRRRVDGALVFLGRIDHQVKIRGHRIELGEIDAVLRRHPQVRDCAVVCHGEGADRRLVAYVVADGEASPEALRAALAERLPDAMLPAAWQLLDRLPRTANGKLDRRALTAPEPDARRASGGPPRGTDEELLAALWSQVLGVERIGRDDDFFALGGHSLVATRVVSRVREVFAVELPLRAVFERPTLSALARRIAALRRRDEAVALPPLVAAPRDRPLPLSFAQQRMWVLHRLDPASALYNVPVAVRIGGRLDRGALAAALAALVRRHEALRTVFRDGPDGPVQEVLPPPPPRLALVDLAALPAGRRAAEVARLAAAEARRPFDLERGPVLRTALLRSGGDEHVLLATMHHAVSDGWSAAIFAEETNALYAAAVSGRPHGLPALPLQYADFARWQRGWLAGEVLAAEVDHWRERLAGVPRVLELPTDRPRPAARSHRGGTVPVRLPAALAAALERRGRRAGATPYMLLLAAFEALLARHSGQRRFTVGTPVAGRTHLGTERLIGFFVNTLVMAADVGGRPTLGELVARVREASLSAQDHQHLPFERLVDELEPVRSLAASPLFQVALVVQNAPDAAAAAAGPEVPALEVAPLDVGGTGAKFDLSLVLEPSAAGIGGYLEYASDLFDATTARRLAGHFARLVAALAEAPETPVDEAPLLSPAERHQVVAEWSDTARPLPAAATLGELFAAVAAARPEAVAVVDGDERLTYRQLDRRSRRFARRLAAAGVGVESRVGLCVARSARMIVALLGIVRAGAAYVPLDPAYPQQRLALLMRDAGVRWLVADEAARAALPDPGPEVAVLSPAVEDADAAAPAPAAAGAVAAPSPDALAYVMFTSGSTGRPKGVAVTHRNVVRLVRGGAYARLDETVTVLQFAPVSFDAATFEIWGPLLNGGRLVLFPGDLPSLDELAAVLEREAVDTLWLTAGLFHQMVDNQPRGLRPLRQLLAGGDALSVPHVHKVLRELPGCTLIDGYGPTETTTFACCHRVTADTVGRSVPIGRPIGNTTARVLDRGLRPAPIGVAGELWVGGEGVARGYEGRPALTAGRFLPDPWAPAPGGRMYRTGDLVRHLPDGLLEFLGRADRQVKVRGFRIELGEIESALLADPRIAEAVVVARDDLGDDKRLVAYVVAGGGEAPSADAMRERLRQGLPPYMLPSRFQVLDALPLDPNGKVDRDRLPAPTAAPAAGRVAPRDEVETALAEVWRELLRLDEVGVDDNFFSLGGDSILAIQASSRSRARGLELSPRQIFEHQTIAELAPAVRRAAGTAAAARGPVTGAVPLTPVVRWFLSLRGDRPGHFNQSLLLTLPAAAPAPAIAAAVDDLWRHHDGLRLRLARDGGGEWRQWIAPPEEGGRPYARIDLDALPAGRRRREVERVCARLQAAFDLARGPLLRAAHLHLGSDEPGRLLLAAHHVAVDGVSWRILLEDLEAAYADRVAGRAPRLPPKGTSLREWSERLAALAGSAGLAEEAEHWLRLAAVPVRPLPRDLAGEDLVASAASVSESLSVDETEALLRRAPAAWRTGADDLLLAALGRVLAGWSGAPAALVDLEGHGRREVVPGVDPSRTVGWLTAVYPVLVEAPAGEPPEETLKRTKDMLRRVPRGGLGFGLLRWGGGDRGTAAALGALRPEVAFNYLGQLDRTTAGASPFRAAPESPGPAEDPRARRLHTLEVGGFVAGGRLTLRVGYSRAVHRAETAAALAAALAAEVRGLVARCTAAGAGGWTPADFPLATIDQRALDALATELGELEDLYPATPIQCAMLAHALANPESTVGFEQTVCTLRGALDLPAFERAWRCVVRRHAILRTALAWEGLDAPLQVVERDPRLSLEVVDLRRLPAAERERRLGDLRRADGERGLDPRRAPMMRLALARVADDAWRFVWSVHHLVIDAWCEGVVLREVFTLYDAFRRGEEPRLEEPPRYADYVRWLCRRDPAGDEAVWRRHLAGVVRPTRLRLAGPAAGAAAEAAHGRHTETLDAARTARLTAAARRHRVTVGTLVSAAWALVLGRSAGSRDVVFGRIVSGRPAEVPGVESMVGLFMNLLPARVQVRPGEDVASWLRRIQEEQAELQLHEHVPLARLRDWCAVPSGLPLFESVVVFENAPPGAVAPGDGAEAPGGGLEVEGVESAVETNYPLTLVAVPGESLLLRLVYDSGRFAPWAVAALGAALAGCLEALAAEALPATPEDALAVPEPPAGGRATVGAAGRLLPPGVPGEVCDVAGRHDGGVALRPTGWTGVRLPDGGVEIWGPRRPLPVAGEGEVDAAEIEAAVASHPAVVEAAVAAVGEGHGGGEDADGGAAALVAVLAVDGAGAPSPAELAAWAARRLPPGLRPRGFVAVDALPRDAAGRVDHAAVARLAGEHAPRRVAPRNLVESKLAELWEEVLGRPVGVTEDFFALGGDSLLALRIMARVRAAFGRDLPLSIFFRGATIEELAPVLRREIDYYRSPVVTIRRSGSRPPLVCVHPSGGSVMCYVPLAAHLADRPLWALEARRREPPIERVEDLAASYLEALDGEGLPAGVALAGWSFGGLVAFEMARQLALRGTGPERLILFDTLAPIPGRPADEAALLDPEDARDLLQLLEMAVHRHVPVDERELAGLDRDGQRELILRRAREIHAVPAEVTVERALADLREFGIRGRMAESYRPSGRFDGEVALFRCREAGAGLPAAERRIVESDPVLGWERWTTRPIVVVPVSGSHGVLFQRPHVDLLGERLGALLATPPPPTRPNPVRELTAPTTLGTTR